MKQPGQTASEKMGLDFSLLQIHSEEIITTHCDIINVFYNYKKVIITEKSEGHFENFSIYRSDILI